MYLNVVSARIALSHHVCCFIGYHLNSLEDIEEVARGLSLFRRKSSKGASKVDYAGHIGGLRSNSTPSIEQEVA